MNELLQVLPLSNEYSTSAPTSIPERVSALLCVIWSELELPLSVVSATPGADGGVWSTVNVWVAGGAGLPSVPDTVAFKV